MLMHDSDLVVFYSGQTDADHRYLSQQYLDNDEGVRTSHPQLRVVYVSESDCINDNVDVLVVENDLADIRLFLKALGNCSLDVRIGLCFDAITLDKLLSSLTNAPQVLSLDFDLVGESERDQRKSFSPTENLIKRIRGLDRWRKTVVLGISNWARGELSEKLVTLIRERGDSVFQKQTALWALLPEIIEDAILRHELRQRLDNLDALEIPTVSKFHDMVGSSNLMRQIYKAIKKAGPSDSAVLILGESGTGKELAANAIVRESTRKDKPFIKVNCAALTESIVESELFGHTKGAFTGAVSDKKGRFEVANHGTIFLDEVGDLPLAVQAKLLRVLQDGTFEPVGSAKPLTVDVRVIAATNSDLAASINEGKFRADLFYRLNVISLKLPPLRDRREDIPLLAKHFLKKHSRHKKVKLEESAMAKLKSHSWRGNIRSLENCIERAVAMCDGHIIRAADLDLEGDIPQPEPRSINRWSFERFVSEEVIGNSNENEYQLLYLMMKTPGRSVSDEELQKIGYDVLSADAETRKKAEKAVRMAFSRLRAKLKNCPDCGWVLPRRTRYVVPK